jgi:hypothetical protein
MYTSETAVTELEGSSGLINKKIFKKSIALVRNQTIPTEQLPLFSEFNANFCR